MSFYITYLKKLFRCYFPFFDVLLQNNPSLGKLPIQRALELKTRRNESIFIPISLWKNSTRQDQRNDDDDNDE